MDSDSEVELVSGTDSELAGIGVSRSKMMKMMQQLLKTLKMTDAVLTERNLFMMGVLAGGLRIKKEMGVVGKNTLACGSKDRFMGGSVFYG